MLAISSINCVENKFLFLNNTKSIVSDGVFVNSLKLVIKVFKYLNVWRFLVKISLEFALYPIGASCHSFKNKKSA